MATHNGILGTSLVLLVVTMRYAYGQGHVRCYDCNYHPSEANPDVSGSTYVNVDTALAGFPRCSLDTAADQEFVDKSICRSGVCFLRQDSNELVYRGCADSWNLPWGVDTSLNCRDQGHGGSIWWFCEGDLCNTGNIGQFCSHDDTPYGEQGPEQEAEEVEEEEEEEEEGRHFINRFYRERVYGGDVINTLNDVPSGGEDSWNAATVNGEGGYAGEGGALEVPWDEWVPDLAPYQEPEEKSHWQPRDESYKSWQPRGDTGELEPALSPIEMLRQEAASKGYQPDLSDPLPEQTHVKAYEPPEKTYEPPQKSYEPPQKSYEPPKKSYEHQKKSYQPPTKGYEPPTKSYQPPTKGYEPPKKSYQPPKNGYEPPKKSYQPPMKGYEPPTKGYEPPTKGYEPPSKVYESPSKSYEAPSKVYEPSSKSEPSKVYEPPSKSYEPPSKAYESPSKSYEQHSKSYEPPSKSYEQPSKSYEPPSKSYEPSSKGQDTKSGAGSLAAQDAYFLGPPPGVVAQYKSQEPAVHPQKGKSQKSPGKSDTKSQDSKGGEMPWGEADIGQPLDDLSLEGFLRSLNNGNPLAAHPDTPESGAPEEPQAYWYEDGYYYYYSPDSEVAAGQTEEHPSEPAQQLPYPPQYGNGGDDNGYQDNAVGSHGDGYQDQENDAQQFPWSYSSFDDEFPQVITNPCDGDCEDNPSGLYPHPRRTDWFIQCGVGLGEDGENCDCCRPHYIRCPRGTSFDTATGVCSKLSDSYEQRIYQPV